MRQCEVQDAIAEVAGDALESLICGRRVKLGLDKGNLILMCPDVFKRLTSSLATVDS